MPSKVWDEIIYPFPNFNGCSIEVWEWISNFITHIVIDVITYSCWDQKLIYVSKKGPWCNCGTMGPPCFSDHRPFSNSRSTTVPWPLAAATWSGVWPRLVLPFTLAPETKKQTKMQLCSVQDLAGKVDGPFQTFLINLIIFENDNFKLCKWVNSLWAQWPYMVTYIGVNTSWDNGLLPDDIKPLPEPMLTYHQWGPGTITVHEGNFTRDTSAINK